MTTITSTSREHTPQVAEVPCPWCSESVEWCAECGNSRTVYTHVMPELTLDVTHAAALLSMVGIDPRLAFSGGGLPLASIPTVRRNIITCLNTQRMVVPYVPEGVDSTTAIMWLNKLGAVLAYAQTHKEDVFWE